MKTGVGGGWNNPHSNTKWTRFSGVWSWWKVLFVCILIYNIRITANNMFTNISFPVTRRSYHGFVICIICRVQYADFRWCFDVSSSQLYLCEWFVQQTLLPEGWMLHWISIKFARKSIIIQMSLLSDILYNNF